MQQARSHIFVALWALWTSLFAPVLWLVLLMGSPPALARKCTRAWSRGVLFLLHSVIGMRYRVSGLDNVPDQPCLIVANHQSAWETIAFLTLFPDVAIVTKHELLKIPIFGSFLRLSPMIMIDRQSGSKAIRQMIDEGAQAIAARRHILIFPEGTRSEPGVPVEFKRGVELLYAKLSCPLLPVAMNSGVFWRPGRGNKRAGTIDVVCLPSIPAGNDPQQAIKNAESSVQAALNQIGAA
jgi:1-acyl-sn-glycerol-3-phosphate acyltransferase